MSYRDQPRSRSSSPSIRNDPSPSGSRYPLSPYDAQYPTEARARARNGGGGQRRSASPPPQTCITPSPLSSLDRALDDDMEMDVDISSVAASAGSEIRTDDFPREPRLPPAPVLTRERLSRHNTDLRPSYDPGAERTDLQPHNRTQWSPPYPAHMHPASRRPNTESRARVRESDNSSVAASVGSDPSERLDINSRLSWLPVIPNYQQPPVPNAYYITRPPWRTPEASEQPSPPSAQAGIHDQPPQFIFRIPRPPSVPAPAPGADVHGQPGNRTPPPGIPSVGIVTGEGGRDRDPSNLASWMLAVHPRTDHMPSALHPRMEDRIGTRQSTLRPSTSHIPVVHMQMGPFGPVGIAPSHTHRRAPAPTPPDFDGQLPSHRDLVNAMSNSDFTLSLATTIRDMVDVPWESPAFMFIPRQRSRDQLGPVKAAELVKALKNVTSDMMEDVEYKIRQEEAQDEEEAGWKCGICLQGQDPDLDVVVGAEVAAEVTPEDRAGREEGETGVKITPCNHLFHGQCLLPWFERRSSWKPLESLLARDALEQLD